MHSVLGLSIARAMLKPARCAMRCPSLPASMTPGSFASRGYRISSPHTQTQSISAMSISNNTLGNDEDVSFSRSYASLYSSGQEQGTGIHRNQSRRLSGGVEASEPSTSFSRRENFVASRDSLISFSDSAGISSRPLSQVVSSCCYPHHHQFVLTPFSDVLFSRRLKPWSANCARRGATAIQGHTPLRGHLPEVQCCYKPRRDLGQPAAWATCRRSRRVAVWHVQQPTLG